MTTSKMNPKVDFFFGKTEKWHDEFGKLRLIALETPLTEELKWGVPCYTLDKKNIILIHGFKEYCAVLFVKGALLKDTNSILIQQTDKVQAARQIRFTNVQEIIEMEPVLKAYINEAIEVEQSGLQIEYKKNTEYVIPEELQHQFDEIPALRPAFEALTPGRQRAYILHFSEPKQSKTRESRIAKYTPQILSGKGLND